MKNITKKLDLIFLIYILLSIVSFFVLEILVNSNDIVKKIIEIDIFIFIYVFPILYFIYSLIHPNGESGKDRLKGKYILLNILDGILCYICIVAFPYPLGFNLFKTNIYLYGFIGLIFSLFPYVIQGEHPVVKQRGEGIRIFTRFTLVACYGYINFVMLFYNSFFNLLSRIG